MESIYQDLASTIQTGAARASTRPYIVAIAGAPGSGKTTLALRVAQLLNAQCTVRKRDSKDVCTTSGDTNNGSGSPVTAQVVGMDGFHIPRAALDQMPNREEAYVRRGAPWTFDAHGFVALVKKLRDRSVSNDGTLEQDKAYPREPILAPSFDHAAKDPVPNSIRINPATPVIIFEGLYLLLDEDVWRDVAALMDLRVFVEVAPDIARMRVAKRHVAAGIEETIEDALIRVDRNDALNGDLIRRKLVGNVDVVIQSIEEVGVLPG